MENRDNTTVAPHGTLSSYVIGFGLSLVLTIVPYYLVTREMLEGGILVAALIIFALSQLIVQLIFFLHLGQESKPRWNLLVFLFMLLVIGIVVVGSLWIMANLDYNMMNPEQHEQLIDLEKQKGF